MLEIPESATVSRQAGKTLVNKTISEVFTATSPHKFVIPVPFVEIRLSKKLTRVVQYTIAPPVRSCKICCYLHDVIFKV